MLTTAIHPSLDQIRGRIEPLRQVLLNHPVYRKIQTPQALCLFMEDHAFAVWDFMSLLKALQQKVCCVSVPWTPPSDPAAAHLINAIVLAEESDEDGRGGFASHFDLYLGAMRACGAGAERIERLVDALQAGATVSQAMAAAGASPHAQRFVAETFAVIDAGDLGAIASAFAFGREDLLPSVFGRIVAEADAASGGSFSEFRYYLDRHIELDGDEHGPMAERLVANLCGDNSHRWARAEQAAVDALEARIALWDGIDARIEAASRAGG